MSGEISSFIKRSFPDIEFKPEDRSFDSKRDDFDVHLPMGSLYKHFIDEILAKPQVDPYLIPDPVRVNYWKERLNSLGKRTLCWDKLEKFCCVRLPSSTLSSYN